MATRGRPMLPMDERKRNVSLRFTAPTYREMKLLADKECVSVGEWVRGWVDRAIAEALDDEMAMKRKTRRKT